MSDCSDSSFEQIFDYDNIDEDEKPLIVKTEEQEEVRIHMDFPETFLETSPKKEENEEVRIQMDSSQNSPKTSPKKAVIRNRKDPDEGACINFMLVLFFIAFFTLVAIFCPNKHSVSEKATDETTDQMNFTLSGMEGEGQNNSTTTQLVEANETITNQWEKEKQELISKAKIEQEKIQHDIKIREIRRNMLGAKRIEDVSEKLLNKWIPDPSRFEKMNNTNTNQTWYFGTPKFERLSKNQMELQMVTTTMKLQMIIPTDDSEYLVLHYDPSTFVFPRIQVTDGHVYMEKGYEIDVTIKDGDLHIHEKITSGMETLEITRVYYIPFDELI